MDIIRFNLNESGLGIIFKEHEEIMIDILLKKRVVTSRETYLEQANILGERKKSRATVINFLNRLMVEYDVIDREIKTCKGGWKGEYKLHDEIKTKYDILKHVVNVITERLNVELALLG